jgi:hypothetical protein
LEIRNEKVVELARLQRTCQPNHGQELAKPFSPLFLERDLLGQEPVVAALFDLEPGTRQICRRSCLQVPEEGFQPCSARCPMIKQGVVQIKEDCSNTHSPTVSA